MNSKISQIEFDKFCENFTVKMSKKGERVLDFKGAKFTISLCDAYFCCHFSKFLTKKASRYFFVDVYSTQKSLLADEMFVEFQNGLKQALQRVRDRFMRYANPRKRRARWGHRSWYGTTIYVSPKTKEKHLKSAKFYEDVYLKLFEENMPAYQTLQ